MATFKILKPYTVQYKNPIILKVGETVALGEEEKEEKWKGWIWTESKAGKGWVPTQILEISDDRKTGVVLEYYSAKELNAAQGDEIEKIKSINGWTWAKNIKNGSKGWIPDEIIG